MTIRYIMFTFLLFTFLGCVKSQKSPYQQIITADKDYETALEYLENYKVSMPEIVLDSLLVKLIQENMDVYSINMTACAITNWKRCEFIPLLEEKCLLFDSFPIDTSWLVRISSNTRRESSVEMTKNTNGLFEKLDKLKAVCNYRH
jgi:hypothetical protein